MIAKKVDNHRHMVALFFFYLQFLLHALDIARNPDNSMVLKALGEKNGTTS